jgi:hypothetical protein
MFKQSQDNPKTELCQLFYKYGSDKCPQIFHSYSEKYYDLLKNKKYSFKNIIEIGIGSNEIMRPIVGEKYQIGSSLRAWRDFFQNANVFGLDINLSVMFECERIITFYTDQSNRDSLVDTISNIRKKSNSNLMFDFIIDDGSHVVSDMTLTFSTLINYLSVDGIYIIEDIKKIDIDYFKEFLISFNNIEVQYIHEGVGDWDSFISIKKIK